MVIGVCEVFCQCRLLSASVFDVCNVFFEAGFYSSSCFSDVRLSTGARNIVDAWSPESQLVLRLRENVGNLPVRAVSRSNLVALLVEEEFVNTFDDRGSLREHLK